MYSIRMARVLQALLLMAFFFSSPQLSASEDKEILHSFKPRKQGRDIGPLLERSPGQFYGAAFNGGPHDCGTVFTVNDDKQFDVLQTFNLIKNGCNVRTTLSRASDGSIYGAVWRLNDSYCGNLMSIGLDNIVRVHDIFGDGSEYGCDTFGNFAIDANDALYGVMFSGGKYGHGTIYRWDTRANALSVVYTFEGEAAAHPFYGLTLASDGVTLYGMVAFTASKRKQSFYRIKTDGTGFELLDFVHHIGKGDISGPMVEGPDGDFYGVLEAPDSEAEDAGLIYRLAKDGTVSKYYSFKRSGKEGWDPEGRLLIEPDGVIYGVTTNNGDHGFGTLYQLTPDGEISVIMKFEGKFGCSPVGGVIRSGDYLYGTSQRCETSAWRVKVPARY
jgi:uncharacterized repeat protein (TIGR03803 family)